MRDRGYFNALDGLRGVAALLVIFTHLTPFVGPAFTPQEGYLAVDFFFMLSGFVVAHAYDPRMATGFGTGRLLKARLLRLYPLFFLSLIVGLLPLAIGHVTGSAKEAGMQLLLQAPHLAFLPTYDPWDFDGIFLFPLNVPLWSLCAEMVVNVIYALFWRQMTTKVIVGLVVGSFAVLAVQGFYFGHTNIGWMWSSASGLLSRVMFAFPMGVLLFRLYQAGRLNPPSVHVTWLALVLAAILMARPSAAVTPFYDLFMLGIGIPMLVAVGANAAAGRILSPLLRQIGFLSFAIYALHYPLIIIALGIDKKLLGGFMHAHAPYSGLVLTGLLAVGAWFVARFYDVPVRLFLAGLLRDKAKRSAGVYAHPAGGSAAPQKQ